MRDVVIIGGGLSGLAAAFELETLGVSYTLIEVKPRLGGSIDTLYLNGFALDSGPMQHKIAEMPAFQTILERYGLAEAVASVAEDVIIFKNGTGALVNALAARVKSPVMYRMAVSTLGRFDASHFSICMENGMLLDAKAIIVAAPARFAERLFYTLTPEISYRLLDYRYDTITRVSVGYEALAQVNTALPEDYPLVAIQHTAQVGRVPPGGALVQVGLRMAEHDLPDDPVGQIAALMGWPLNPMADHIATWPESDPLMWRDEGHIDNMTAIFHLLPPGVALAGSDYIPTDQPPRLDERIQQGVAAAHRVISWLKSI